MSLFGESPPDRPASVAAANSKSLFGDDSKPQPSSSSLFNTDDSPWSMPTPKKAARQNLVKSLLPATEVPESYIDAFDNITNSSEGSAGGVHASTVRRILGTSGLASSDQDRILNIVLPTGKDSAGVLGRNEFNVLLALIGLGQEEDEISLDSVDERRKRLPEPRIGYISDLKTQRQTPTKAEAPPAPAPATPKPMSKPRQDSFGTDPSNDPWASPAIKNIPPSTAAHTLKPTGVDDIGTKSLNGVARTTSSFTTNEQTISSSSQSMSTSTTITGNAWGSYNGSNAGGFPEPSSLGADGFGSSGNATPERPKHPTSTSVGASVAIPRGTGELATVTILPDKEGVFLFQHHNYEVNTIRRGSNVVRRYSDFVWLLDCLQKRYPFRRLPLLPPKRIQVNGNHLAADGFTFLEKRRKGLTRFMNALIQHPVLSQETLVVMFLTVPTELSVWRKQATISVQEEFVGRALPLDLEDSLPSTLPELFEQVRAGVKRTADVYIGLCMLMERLAKRNEAMAVDNLKFSQALESLTDGSMDTYAIDTNDVPLLNDGINATAKHLATTQALLLDEGRAWDGGVIEDLKKIRDAMVSMKDMFDRRDRYARDNIPQLERRIQNSENKLVALRQKPPGTVKPGEMEKVESSITADKESIIQQHARGVFIKECVRDEIVTFQSTIFTISHLHQDWAQERVKYAELQASNWRSLVDDIESMPVGE